MLKETARLLGRVNGMQRGYTTGTTAQAAVKGAALMALNRKLLERVSVTLPGGLEIPLALEECSLNLEGATCSVRKDPGDDRDITKGMAIYAQVTLTDTPGLIIEGGKGVGRITRAGLATPPGEAAINPVPLQMIRNDLASLCPKGKGFSVVITIPQGEELAQKTWNPKLGIEGGLSIIGTTGIVEPKSDAAYVASIKMCVDMSYSHNPDFLCVTLGYVGDKALAQEEDLIDPRSVVKCGDHVGETLGYAAEKGFKQIYLVGHIGKLVKLAIGIFNTHWESGDGRLETLAALATVHGAKASLVKEIMELKLAEEAVSLLEENHLAQVFDDVEERILGQINKRYSSEGSPRFRVSMVNLEGRALGSEKSLNNFKSSSQTESSAQTKSPPAKLSSPIKLFSVVGIGPGGSEYLLPMAEDEIDRADLLLGGQRHLDLFAHRGKDQLCLAGKISELPQILSERRLSQRVVVLVSGDPGYHSLLSLISRHFDPHEYRVIPGISSFQLAAARTGKVWQNDLLLSLHGKAPHDWADKMEQALGENRRVFCLTDKTQTPAWICGELPPHFGDFRVDLFYRLGHNDEHSLTQTVTQTADPKGEWKMKEETLCLFIINPA